MQICARSQPCLPGASSYLRSRAGLHTSIMWLASFHTRSANPRLSKISKLRHCRPSAWPQKILVFLLSIIRALTPQRAIHVAAINLPGASLVSLIIDLAVDASRVESSATLNLPGRTSTNNQSRRVPTVSNVSQSSKAGKLDVLVLVLVVGRKLLTRLHSTLGFRRTPYFFASS